MTVNRGRFRVAALVLLLALDTAAAAAQRPAPRAPALGEFMLMVGGSQLDIGDLNARFAAAGYPTFDDQFLTVGFVTARPRDGFRFGVELAGQLRPSGTTADNRWRTQLSAGYVMFNVGYEAFREGGFALTPKVGLGGGGVTLSIADRQAPTFDEVLAQPGRGVDMTAASLVLDGSIGLRYRIGGPRAPAAGQRAWLLGARAGYMQSLLRSEWTRATTDAPGGPDAGWGGPHFEFMIGRTTRR